VSAPRDLIDEVELAAQTYDDPALKAEILNMLLEQAPVLWSAIEASDGVARSDVAHRLRGSALALAATSLAEAAADLEANPAKETALHHLRDVLTDTLSFARHLLQKVHLP
jgi:HPt (histidine-containing phosphotransfer) domain-containing protein